jgi:hypothetical protein
MSMVAATGASALKPAATNASGSHTVRIRMRPKMSPRACAKLQNCRRRLWHNVTGGTNSGQTHSARSHFSGE